MDIKSKNNTWHFYAFLLFPTIFFNSLVLCLAEIFVFNSFSILNIIIAIVLTLLSLIYIVFCFKKYVLKPVISSFELYLTIMLLIICAMTIPINTSPYMRSSLYGSFYHTLIQDADDFQSGAIIFFYVALPFSYILIYSLYNIYVIIKNGHFREKSHIMHFICFLGKRQSVRRKLLLEVIFLSIPAAIFSIALWYYVTHIDNNVTSHTYWIYAILPIALELIFLALVFAGKRSSVGEIENISKIISESTNGSFPTENPLSPNSPLFETGESLIELGRLTDEGIKKGIAGEKLKVELITNVSHDLRTPLTSIVGYCEQLEAMELPNEASSCIASLGKKARYLNDMVDDLFDLAKAASGNANITLSMLNMHKLIEQTLGEMNDKIECSGFTIKPNLQAENNTIMADGVRLHRVIQNLLDNAIKYSLKGTRIFISSYNEAGNIVVSILNTASYDMDFGDKDLTERFSRGDSSRTGEGSGLGLAISKTYIDALGGEFDIKIKGDQFEAILQLPLIN